MIHTDQPRPEPTSETECEDNPEDKDYKPCEEGFYCADNACNQYGVEYHCCKPILLDEERSETTTAGDPEHSSVNECEDDPDDKDYRPCEEGFYCAEDACNVYGEEYDCCKPISREEESSETTTEGIDAWLIMHV